MSTSDIHAHYTSHKIIYNHTHMHTDTHTNDRFEENFLLQSGMGNSLIIIIE